MPLCAVYALLFAEHDLGPGQITTLFVAWSVTAFALEVPSGAWADTVDRRLLLVLGGLVYVAAFTCWMAFPSYLGFLAGFVLWGLSDAMVSGTFEALLHDQLAAAGREAEYPRVRGLTLAAATVAELVAMAAAAGLMSWGSFVLTGWSSVGMAVVHTLVAAGLPRAVRAEEADDLRGRGSVGRRYLATVRAGLSEVARIRPVRRAVLLAAATTGLVAAEEFLPLVGAEQGLARHRCRGWWP